MVLVGEDQETVFGVLTKVCHGVSSFLMYVEILVVFFPQGMPLICVKYSQILTTANIC